MRIWKRSSVVLLLALSLASVGVAGQEPDRPAETRSWIQLFPESGPVPRQGLRSLSLSNSGPLPVTAAGLNRLPADAGVRIQWVSVTNPRLDEVVAVSLYWRLYEESGLKVPVASGVTKSEAFEYPVTIHGSESIKPALEVIWPKPDATYRLEIGVESVTYKNGEYWQRPTDSAGGRGSP